MAIPDYQQYMYPLIKMASDKGEHTCREAYNVMAQHFGLTEDEIKERLPSGKKTKVEDRVAWALTYLKKAKIFESTSRGKFRITDRGLEVLASKPKTVDSEYLGRFSEFLEFKPEAKKKKKSQSENIELLSEQTPEEILETSYQILRNELAQELLEYIMKCSPKFFERLVVDLLVAMGYGGSLKDAGQAVGHSGDGGIDGIIKEDKLGLDNIFIQAKRWEVTVGRPNVQAFAGALIGKKANKGVMISTSRFSKEAEEYVKTISQNIVLINGEQLTQLMIDYGIGVNNVNTYTIKKVDIDYFEE